MVVGLINYHNMVLIHGNIGNGRKNRGMRLLYLPCRGTEQCHPDGMCISPASLLYWLLSTDLLSK